MSKYPITHQPTAAFLATLEKQKDPRYALKDLVFVQQFEHGYTATFQLCVDAGRASEVHVGLSGLLYPTIADIENRVLEMLKPDGRI